MSCDVEEDAKLVSLDGDRSECFDSDSLFEVDAAAVDIMMEGGHTLIIGCL